MNNITESVLELFEGKLTTEELALYQPLRATLEGAIEIAAGQVSDDITTLHLELRDTKTQLNNALRQLGLASLKTIPQGLRSVARGIEDNPINAFALAGTVGKVIQELVPGLSINARIDVSMAIVGMLFGVQTPGTEELHNSAAAIDALSKSQAPGFMVPEAEQLATLGLQVEGVALTALDAKGNRLEPKPINQPVLMIDQWRIKAREHVEFWQDAADMYREAGFIEAAEVFEFCICNLSESYPPKTFRPKANITQQVSEFHRAFDFKVRTVPTTDLDLSEMQLRLRLITEETLEILEACGVCVEGLSAEIYGLINNCICQVDLAALADGLADLDYVVEGTRLAFGIPRLEVAAEVHRSNMSKRGGEKDERGKWKKPDNWTPPNIQGVLQAKGWVG